MNTGPQQDGDGLRDSTANAGCGLLGHRSRRGVWLLVAATLVLGTIAYAQFGGRRGMRRGGGYGESNSSTPSWKNPDPFKHDVFTFARVQYDSGGWGGRGGWATDYSDADINLLFRLQQMTSMKVNDHPQGKVLRLTDPDLFHYPFIYIVEPGSLYLSTEEAAVLRKYLLNGGFLMCDDFWGENEWANLEDNIRKVFPDREFADVPASHPIFKGLFPLDKNKLQTPNVRLGMDSQYTGITWEREDAKEVHFRAIHDDKGRMMVLACHNTDNGDGWEREGENEYFFREFSEKKNYPLAINVFLYVMSH